MTDLTPENQPAADPAASRELDETLGLETIQIKLPARIVRALTCDAEQKELSMNAMVRNILQSYGQQIADRTQAHHVVLDIIAERARQDAQWGGPEHDDAHGLEDFCDLINQRTGGLARGFESAEEARRRMIQIAALAVAAVESMDRKQSVRCSSL